VALAAGLLALLEVYGPALRGPFVFDDMYLPFTNPAAANEPWYAWLVGVRPLLYFSFWVNLRLSGLEPFSYHLFNVALHFISGVLAFLIVRRLLSWNGTEGSLREVLSAFAAGLFLLHPVQTESVSYIASRSETLSVMFLYAAVALFLYRRAPAISWSVSLGILLLFGAAVTTKEHTAALPAVLLLTDYYFSPGARWEGIRRNWRLYLPIAVAGVVALRFVRNVLRLSDSAGFGLADFSWYQYFYTQCRAIWVYIRLFFVPYGQTLEYDTPISGTLLEHGAILGLAGLLALVVAAICYRRRYPLASYGFFVFLLLLAPTSSLVPIADPVAEHRLYLPMIGLLLVAAEFLRRLKIGRRALAGSLAGLLLIAAWLSYQRNQLWGDEIALWEDAVANAPRKVRPHFQLAFAYYKQQRCDLAVQHYEAAAELGKPDSLLLTDWALACDCLGHWQEAITKLRQAASMRRTANAYSLIGYVYGKQGKRTEALEALDTAAKLAPGYSPTYLYRGNVYFAAGELKAAADEYWRVLRLDPHNEAARQGLANVESRLKTLR
jgi:tetratricopeptide (TPR) repeat protein